MVRMMLLQYFRLCLFGVSLALGGAVQAQAIQKPKGPIVLQVSGLISKTNAGGSAQFDAAMLEALPATQHATGTPWHDKVTVFSGPSLRSVLDAVGAKGKMLRMAALDKYEVLVPIEDADLHNPVLAMRADGKLLTVRQKGPLFMIYPFDTNKALKNDTYYTRSIWQLRTIVVE